MDAKTNCAGSGCPERTGCRRYEARVIAHYVVRGEVRIPVLAWASLDIERAAYGSCPARIPVHQHRRAA